MGYAVFIAIVGGAMLLVGAGVWLLIKPLFLRTRFAVSAVIASLLSLVLAVMYTLDGRLLWQGAIHFAMTVAWLVLLGMNARERRRKGAQSRTGVRFW